MVVVGKEGTIFVVFGVGLPSGKAVGGTTEGTVSTCEDGVIAKDWLRSMEQEETTRLKMRNQWLAN